MKNAFEAASLLFRFAFIALMLLTVWRAWQMTVQDRRRAKVLRDWIPQTGSVGELVALKTEKPVKRAQAFILPREGVIGASRKADVRIRGDGILPKHTVFELRDGGIVLRPLGGADVVLGDDVTGEKLLARDGDRATLGGIPFQLVLYSVPEGILPGMKREIPAEPAELQLFDVTGEKTKKRARKKNVSEILPGIGMDGEADGRSASHIPRSKARRTDSAPQVRPGISRDPEPPSGGRRKGAARNDDLFEVREENAAKKNRRRHV